LSILIATALRAAK